jgi:ubiquinone/menaquinone biosynthesis C-methylase UbiE
MSESSRNFALPYFDRIVEGLDQGNPVLEKVVGRNVHWGYWDDPQLAIHTPEDFSVASDRLTERLLNWAKLEPGQDVLDVGCGFGGTMALINETYTDLNLVGLNIDPRQVKRAIDKVQPLAKNGNKISFVAGDACNLPFPDRSQDVVLAVECIFHFPSRRRFFEEVARVLRPNGKLVLCDFLVTILMAPIVVGIYFWFRKSIKMVYGPENKLGSMMGYQYLAKHAGFDIIGVEDMTRHTLPTYKTIRTNAEHSGFDAKTFIRAQSVQEYGSKLGAVKYDIISFRPKAR